MSETVYFVDEAVPLDAESVVIANEPVASAPREPWAGDAAGTATTAARVTPSRVSREGVRCADMVARRDGG